MGTTGVLQRGESSGAPGLREGLVELVQNLCVGFDDDHLYVFGRGVWASRSFNSSFPVTTRLRNYHAGSVPTPRSDVGERTKSCSGGEDAIDRWGAARRLSSSSA